MENVFNDFSELEIKKTKIVLNIEHISCNKCGNLLELDKWIPSDEGDNYYQEYACSKCKEAHIIKKYEPTYPRISFMELEKEIGFELNKAIADFLWQYTVDKNECNILIHDQYEDKEEDGKK
jgi:hypothetical protein